jgi:hypothetical protein
MKNETVILSLDKEFVQSIIADHTNKNIADAIMASGADLGIILKGCFGYVHNARYSMGMNVHCSHKIWDYSTQESKDKDDTVIREMGECKIIGFHPYNNLYMVEYDYYGKSSQSLKTMNVEAHTLS